MQSPTIINVAGIRDELFELVNGYTFTLSRRMNDDSSWTLFGDLISFLIMPDKVGLPTGCLRLRIYCHFDLEGDQEKMLVEQLFDAIAVKLYRDNESEPVAIKDFVRGRAGDGEFDVEFKFPGPGHYTIWLQEVERNEESALQTVQTNQLPDMVWDEWKVRRRSC